MCGGVVTLWQSVKNRGQPLKPALSLHHVNSRDQTQAIRLANEDLWVKWAIVLVRVFQLNKLESCGKREFLHWGITSMILAYGCVCGAVSWGFSQLWVVLHQLWRWSHSVTFPHGFSLSFYFRSPAWVSPSTSALDGLWQGSISQTNLLQVGFGQYLSQQQGSWLGQPMSSFFDCEFDLNSSLSRLETFSLAMLEIDLGGLCTLSTHSTHETHPKPLESNTFRRTTRFRKSSEDSLPKRIGWRCICVFQIVSGKKWPVNPVTPTLEKAVGNDLKGTV